MSENDQIQIKCEHCGKSTSITQALTLGIGQKLEKQYQKKIQKDELKLKQRSDEIDQEKSRLEAQTLSLNKDFEKRLIKEKKVLEDKLRKQIDDESNLESLDLRNQVLSLDEKLKLSQNNELELRKKSRELDEIKRNLDLEIERKVSIACIAKEEEVEERLSLDFRRILAEKDRVSAEKDKRASDQNKRIEDLNRNSEQGSQQLQGETFEIQMEELLRSSFPMDIVEPVAKGIKGADIIQRVTTNSGLSAGIILWEVKQTKSWSDSWLDKLREDQRAATAEHAVIVTQTLPKGASGLIQMDGIWVTDLKTVVGLAHALRITIIQVQAAKSAAIGRTGKSELVYQYLTGTQFKHRVEAIVEAFLAMRDGLDKEKRAFHKMWASRDQQITKVINGTAGMYGDIQGIIGASLPLIDHFELIGESTEIEEVISVL